MGDEFKSNVMYSTRFTIPALMIAFLFASVTEALSSTAGVYYSTGQGYMEKSQYDMAALAFEKAVELSPDWPEAHNALGEAYAKLLRFDEALVQFNKAIELKPDYLDAKINQRRTTMSVERYKPAESSRFSQKQKFSILGLLTIAIAATIALVIYSYSS